jgi:hypothetical protein
MFIVIKLKYSVVYAFVETPNSIFEQISLPFIEEFNATCGDSNR